MGFSYAMNWKGNEVLCCDFCDGFVGDSKGTKYVRKIRCPFGYCQPYATCNNCKSKNNKELHLKNKCDVYAEEFRKSQEEKQKLLNDELFLRTSAISRNDTEVEVTFRNKDLKERTFLMKHSTYDSIPLMANSTIEDYQKIENITEI